MGELVALMPGQATFLLMYVWTICLWLLSEYLNRVKPAAGEYTAISTDVELQQGSKEGAEGPASGHGNGPANGSLNGNGPAGHASPGHGKRTPSASGAVVEAEIQICQTTEEGKGAGRTAGRVHSWVQDAASSGLIRCMLFDMEAIKRERDTLKTMAEFGTLMLWYFLCDRTPVMGSAEKHYSRDLFLFLFVVLTCVAFGSSTQTLKMPVLLARQQTEEWKGWMQVLFLLYHYYEAREAYNAIRIFIAAYVWMTGFGNFSYYYKTGDYCVGRFCQMMWRLNFLVFFTCLVMGNSYMLYYICPMHTIFTILVYACLGIAPQYNQYNVLLLGKMVLCVLMVLLCWDVKPVFNALWRPLTWLVGYMDPRKQNQEVLYEWYFRSSLDRFVWIYGMLCAWVHPWAAAFLTSVDNLTLARRVAVRSCLLSACAVVGYFWYIHVYCLPKAEYNAIHPYTSWIPITLFIIVRNLTPSLRLNHMRLYGWLGCITLETYIGQFHIWLSSSIKDGQPKLLLSLLPGYPLLNFALVSAGYVFVSFRLFNLTNTLKNVAVPHSNDTLLLRNIILMAGAGATLYFVCFGFMAALGY